MFKEPWALLGFGLTLTYNGERGKQNKLVKGRREGKSVFYSLADDHVRTIIEQGIDHIAE